MITYNAKDLIQQATMLADLQNSDFISWKENIMFLDNAWTELYQSLINHGDKTYLQEFSFSGERTYLPDDFYQLYYVCYTNGTYEKPIARKSKTSTGQGPYYDIVGNELIIYRDSVSNMNKIKVQYYPVKFSITYKANEIDLNRDNEMDFGAIYDVADRYVLVESTSGREIWDIINGQKYGNTVSTASMLCMNAGKPVGVHKYDSNVYFKVNNIGYYGSYSSGTISIQTAAVPRTIKQISLSSDFWDSIEKSCTGTFVGDTLYVYASYQSKSGVYEVANGTPRLIASCTSTDIVSFNGNIYYSDNTEGIVRNDKVLYPIDTFNTFNGVMKEDLNTGYGILIDKYILRSNFEDTELNFPNNFYYNILAYRLAIYYKIKQNADFSGLSALLANAEKTFYDTLPRDENNFVRIANAYAY